MVKLSYLLGLTAALCLSSANAVTTTDLPDLPDITNLVGGGLYHTRAAGGGGGGGSGSGHITHGNGASGDGLTAPEEVTPGNNDETTSNDETSSDDGAGDIPEAEPATNGANPFPKGGVKIHKSNKSSKNNKDGGNSVSDTTTGGAKSTTTSTYLRG